MRLAPCSRGMAAIWAGGGELVGWLGEKGGVERGGMLKITVRSSLLLSLSSGGRGREERDREEAASLISRWSSLINQDNYALLLISIRFQGHRVGPGCRDAQALFFANKFIYLF